MYAIPKEIIAHQIATHLLPEERQVARMVSKKFFRAIPAESGTDILLLGISNGNEELISLGISRRSSLDIACHTAIIVKDAELLRRLVAAGYPCGDRVCDFAAAHGSAEILEFLVSKGHLWDAGTLNIAAAGNNKGAFKFAWERGCPRNLDILFIILTMHERRGLITYLYSRGCEYPAGIYGRLAGCAKSILEHLCSLDARISREFRAD